MDQLSQLACDPIPCLDEDKEQTPTREDVHDMLEKPRKHTKEKKPVTPSEFRASTIPGFDERRGEMPTRKDTRKVLRKYKGKILFFNISFNPIIRPGRIQSHKKHQKNKKSHQKGLQRLIDFHCYSTRTEKIAGLLWERYGLYKIRSNKGKPHSLNRSMYIGLIKEEGIKWLSTNTFYHLIFFWTIT